jgi:hypothetical protein
MKRLSSVALVSFLALVGCQNASRLDKATKEPPKTPPPSAVEPVKADHSGSLEERVARLEDNFAKYGETLEWVSNIKRQQDQQQKAQQEQQQRNEPDPDGVFAVDVAPDVKAGQVEGSPQALVTIVEAWDFA